MADINDVLRVTCNSGVASAETMSATVNLSAFAGPAAATMFDNGTNGDQVAGNGVWTLDYTVRAGNVVNGVRNVSVSATDNAGNTGFANDTSNLVLDNGPEATFTSGGTTVSVYDVASSVDVDPANVIVKFTPGDGVQKIKLVGTDPMNGLGLVISGAPKLVNIKDARKGGPGNLAFVASNSKIQGLKLKSGMTGYNLNGLTLGGIAFGANIDGDGSTTDTQVIWGSAGAGKLKINNDVTGDIWLLPGSKALGSLKIQNGDYSGEMSIHGDADLISIKGGNLGSKISVFGNLKKLLLLEKKGIGGHQLAGSNIFVQNLLRNGKINDFNRNNGDVDYGIIVGSLGKLQTGGVKLTQSDLTFRDNDYVVQLD